VFVELQLISSRLFVDWHCSSSLKTHQHECSKQNCHLQSKLILSNVFQISYKQLHVPWLTVIRRNVSCMCYKKNVKLNRSATESRLNVVGQWLFLYSHHSRVCSHVVTPCFFCPLWTENLPDSKQTR